jgi:hypothetical protein
MTGALFRRQLKLPIEELKTIRNGNPDREHSKPYQHME